MCSDVTSYSLEEKLVHCKVRGYGGDQNTEKTVSTNVIASRLLAFIAVVYCTYLGDIVANSIQLSTDFFHIKIT